MISRRKFFGVAASAVAAAVVAPATVPDQIELPTTKAAELNQMATAYKALADYDRLVYVAVVVDDPELRFELV